MREISLHLRLFKGTARRMYSVPELPPAEWLLATGLLSLYAVISVFELGLNVVTWIPVGVMFIALLLLMTGDLMTEYFGMPPSERHLYLWEREITGKFLLLALVAMSLVLDVVLFYAASALPNEFPVLSAGYPIITMSSTLWLIAGEVSRITTNIAKHEGEEAIPPAINVVIRHIRWVLKTLRVIDEKRHRAADPQSVKYARWYETISDREIEELVEFLEKKRTAPPAAITPIVDAEKLREEVRGQDT